MTPPEQHSASLEALDRRVETVRVAAGLDFPREMWTGFGWDGPAEAIAALEGRRGWVGRDARQVWRELRRQGVAVQWVPDAR